MNKAFENILTHLGLGVNAVFTKSGIFFDTIKNITKCDVEVTEETKTSATLKMKSSEDTFYIKYTFTDDSKRVTKVETFHMM